MSLPCGRSRRPCLRPHMQAQHPPTETGLQPHHLEPTRGTRPARLSGTRQPHHRPRGLAQRGRRPRPMLMGRAGHAADHTASDQHGGQPPARVGAAAEFRTRACPTIRPKTNTAGDRGESAFGPTCESNSRLQRRPCSHAAWNTRGNWPARPRTAQARLGGPCTPPIPQRRASATDSPQPVLTGRPDSGRGPVHHAAPDQRCGRSSRVCPRAHMRAQHSAAAGPAVTQP